MIVPEGIVETDDFLQLNMGVKKCAIFALW
jgi:hypothetical protein